MKSVGADRPALSRDTIMMLIGFVVTNTKGERWTYRPNQGRNNHFVTFLKEKNRTKDALCITLSILSIKSTSLTLI